MEAIILAGGLGTRLKKVVPDLPKPMATIAGKPFLEILLSSLAIKGVKHIIFSVGYMADKIINYFGNNFAGMEIVYEVENTPLGTGGAIHNALKHCHSDHVFILNGDTFLDADLVSIELVWQRQHIPLIIACEVPDTSRYGRLNINQDNQVISFSEKGASGKGIINAGSYLLPTNIFNDYNISHPFSFETDFLTKIIHKVRFNTFITTGKFIDIGIPEDYARAQLELLNLVFEL